MVSRALNASEVSAMYNASQSNASCANIDTTNIFTFPGATSCTAGAFISAGVCTVCPAGTYSVGGNATICANCPTGTYSSAQGASRCAQCQSGFVSMGSFCQACAVDSFFNATTGQCQHCVTGTGTNGRLAQDSCSVTLASPSDVSIANITASSFTVSWMFVMNTTARFVVQSQNNGFATGFATVSAGVSPAVTSYNATHNIYSLPVMSLAALTTYSVQVVSAIGAVSSVPSSRVTATTMAVAPSAPATVTLLTSNSSAITVSWSVVTPSSSLPDAAISFYILQLLSSTNDVVRTINITASKASWTIVSLNASTNYKVRVQAVIAAGLASSWAPATPLAVTTAAAAPAALTSVSCTMITSTTCLLTFEGTLSLQQIVTLFNSTGQLVKNAVLTSALAARGYLFTGLTPNTTYTANVVQVAAKAGASPSISYRFTTLLPAPKIVSLTAGGGIGWLAGATITVGFDVDTNMGNISLANTGAITSMLTFSPSLVDAANINAAWTDGRTLVMTFADVTAGAAPQAGQLTVSVDDSVNLQAVGMSGSDISTASSPPLSGGFGQLSPILLLSNSSDSRSISEGSQLSFGMMRDLYWLSVNDTQLAILARSGNSQLMLTINATAGALTQSTTTLVTNNVWSRWAPINFSVPDQYKGPLSLFMTLSLRSGEVIDNGAITFTITTFNHPPTISVNAAMLPKLYSEQPGSLAGLYIINDPDVAIYPSFMLKMQLTLDSGAVSFTSVPAAVLRSGNQLMGTLADLQLALQSLTLTLPMSNKNSTFLVTLNDLANGGPGAFIASQTISLCSDCSQLAAPVISGAMFSNDGSQLVVSFDRTFTLSTSIAPLSVFSADSIASFGAGATAAQSGSTAITVQLGTGPTVSLGTPISVADRTLARCATSIYYANSSISVPVRAPRNPVVPVVTLNGPSVVSSCDAVTFSTISSGLAGRTGSFSWSGTNNMLLPTASYGSSVALPGGSLIPGTSYTTAVSVSNFLGVASRPAILTFNVSSLPLPLLAIQGPQVSVLYLYQLPAIYTLRSSTILSACWSAGNQQLLFQWTDTNGNASAPLVAAASTTASSLSLPTAQFESGRMYTYTLTATAMSDASLTVSATVSLYFAIPPLELSAVTSSSLSVSSLSSTAMAVTLQDPSLNTVTSFLWTCVTTDGDVCIDQTRNDLNPLDLSVVNGTSARIGSGVLSPDQYVFSVQAMYGDANDGTLTVSNVVEFGVLVSADPIPSVVLSILAPLSANTFGTVLHDSAVTITASAQLPDGTNLLSSNPDVTFIWLLDGPDTDMLSTADATADSSNTLNLNQGRQSGYFSQGARYSYTVFIYYYDEVTFTLLESSASVTLLTGVSPSQGQLIVTPDSGVSLNTTFTLSAIDWVGQTDLSYAFYTYQQDINGVMQQSLLSAFSPSPSITLSYLAAGNLTLGVMVRDLFNATANYEVSNVIVTTPVFAANSRRLLSEASVIDSLTTTMTSGVTRAANTLDGSSILLLLNVVNQQLQSVMGRGDVSGRRLLTSDDTGASEAVVNFKAQMLNTVQQYASYASPSQVAQSLASLTQDRSTLTVGVTAGIDAVVNALHRSAQLHYNDYSNIIDAQFNVFAAIQHPDPATATGARRLLATSTEQAEALTSLIASLINTLVNIEQQLLTGDGSSWSRVSQDSQAYVLRFDALSRSNTSLTVSSNGTVRAVPILLANNSAAISAMSTGQPVLRDVRAVTFPASHLAFTVDDPAVLVSDAVGVQLADTQGTVSNTLDTLSLIVTMKYNTSACVNTELSFTTQSVCQLVCVRYDESAQSLVPVSGCVAMTSNNGDGTSTATYTVNSAGFYVLMTYYTITSNATSDSSSSGYYDDISSSSGISSLSSGLSSSSGSDDYDELSSSSQIAASLSSSSAKVPADSSSTSQVIGSSSSSAAAITPSSSASVSQSSSTGVAGGLPVGSIKISMLVMLPYAVNASNYGTVTALFQQDITANLAPAFNITQSVLAPYIVITGLGDFGISRRLLQTGSMRLGFVILGNISNVVTNAGAADTSLVAAHVADRLVAQVTSGQFVASNAGATVPRDQTITVTPISTASSSSSTGTFNEVLPQDGSSNDRDVRLGVGIGIGLGLPLTLLVAVVGFLYYKGLGPFRPQTAGVGPRSSMDYVEAPKPTLKDMAAMNRPKTVVNIHTEEGEVIHTNIQQQSEEPIQEPIVHV